MLSAVNATFMCNDVYADADFVYQGQRIYVGWLNICLKISCHTFSLYFLFFFFLCKYIHLIYLQTTAFLPNFDYKIFKLSALLLIGLYHYVLYIQYLFYSTSTLLVINCLAFFVFLRFNDAFCLLFSYLDISTIYFSSVAHFSGCD